MLRIIKTRSRSTYEHQHVAAHQDDYTKYEHLEFEAKLNYKCDEMAKEAIDNFVESKGAYEGMAASTDAQKLPLESNRVFVKDIK